MTSGRMQHSRPLRELRRSDEPQFGGKSAGLGELLAGGIPVPPGFAIGTSAFGAFMSESGLAERIAQTMGGLDPDDLDGINAASRGLGEALRSASIPEAVQEEIARRYEELGRDPAVAVRSSAAGEDSADATFAGQQDSYLWVRGAARVAEAVRDCWASLYSPTAISYRARLAGAHAEPAMAVVVQLMAEAEVSGVMFTCNPVSGDPSMVAINASWGLGLAVVGGDVTPDDYLVSKVTGEIVRERINPKLTQYVPDAGGDGTVRVEVPADRREAPCLAADAIAELVDIARRIERHFGSHQDIEWTRAPDGTVHIVQSRPVTTLVKRVDAPKPASAIAMVMSTFGVKNAAE